MKKLILVALVVTCALPAAAEPDQLGVYFDPAAISSIAYYPPNTPFDVYIAINEPSAGTVHGLEFAYELLMEDGTAGHLVRLAVQMPAQAVDLGDHADPLRGEHIVGLGTPLPGAPVVNFVTWTMMVLADVPVYFTIGPIRRESIADGLPAYEAGGLIVPLEVDATVGFPSPVLGGSGYPFAACLNDCVISVEGASFGTIKALYR